MIHLSQILLASAVPPTRNSQGKERLEKERIRVEAEFRDIKKEVSSTTNRDCISISECNSLTYESLRKTLQKSRPQLLHFSGHGQNEGIYLEKDNGDPEPVTNIILVDLLKHFSNSIQCIVLNSCTSENLAKKLALFFSDVICTNGELEDEVAHEFSKVFYYSLGQGYSVEDSFNFSNNAIKQINNLKGYLTEYILLTNRSDDEKLRPFINKKCIDSLKGLSGSPISIALERQVEHLTDELSKEVYKNYIKIDKKYSEGHTNNAIEELLKIKRKDNWRDINTSVKATIIEKLARYQSIDNKDIKVIEDAISEIEDISPTIETKTLEIYLNIYSDNIKKAKQLCSDLGTIESLHLKASIEYEEKDVNALKNTIDLINSKYQPTDVTYRLQALLYLEDRDIIKAKEYINFANDIAPSHAQGRALTAIIIFWECSTPAAIIDADSLLAPHPLTPEFFKKDKSSTEKIISVSNEFNNLNKLQLAQLQSHFYQTWELLSSIVSEQKEKSVSLLKLLLETDYDVSIYVMWCQIYNMLPDINFLKNKLTSIENRDDRYINYLGIYYSILIYEGDAEKVLEKLDDSKAVFQKQNRMDSWYYWRVDCYRALNDPDEVRKNLEQLRQSDINRAFLSLETQMLLSGDKEAFLKRLHELYERYDSPVMLFNYCDESARQSKWINIKKNKKKLLKLFPVPESISLIAHAEFYLGRVQKTLEVLNKNIDKFPESKLSYQLKVIEIRSLEETSNLNLAIEKAKQLVDENHTASAFIVLLDVLVVKGDVEELKKIAYQFLGLNDATGDHLLHVANLTNILNSPVSQLLWDEAVKLGSSKPSFSMEAYLIGQALGVDSELTNPLLQKALTIESEQNIPFMKKYSFKEMIKMMRSHQEENQNLYKMYSQGEIPIHILPRNTLQPLSVLFHSNPSSYSRNYNPVVYPPIWARHGGRPINCNDNNKIKDIVIDYTALIISEHIGVFDLIIDTYQSVYLPHKVQHYLLSEIDSLRPSQVSRLEATKQVAQLVKENAIELVDIEQEKIEKSDEGLLKKVGKVQAQELVLAKKRKGILLDYLPLQDLEHERKVDFPIEWTDYISDAKSVIKYLIENKIISNDSSSKISETFRREYDGSYTYPSPKKDQHLIVSSTLLIQFAEVNILNTICRFFHLICDEFQWKREEQELKQSSIHANTIEWLMQFNSKINKYISSHAINLLPASEVDRESNCLLDEGLINILTHNFSSEDTVWFDDRNMTGYPLVNGASIVSSVDVLRSLLRDKAINKEQYYQYINDLRVMNYRYVPLTENEILYWLRKASAKKGVLQEIKQLKIIRNYWNACLWGNEFILPWKKLPKNKVDEITFIAQSKIAVINSISNVWKDLRLNINRKIIRSQWLLDSLYVGLVNMRELHPNSKPNLLDLLSSDISSLLTLAFVIPGQKINEKVLQKEYIDWINEQLIIPRLKVDPDCLHLICNHIVFYIEGLFSSLKNESKNYNRALIISATDFVLLLPKSIRNELFKNKEFIKKLAFTTTDVIKVDDYTFEASQFYKSLENAMALQSSRLECTKTSKYLTMSPINDVLPVKVFSLTLEGSKKKINHGIAEPNRILDKTKKERIKLLENNLYITDGDPRPLKQIENDLSKIKEPVERVSKLNNIQNLSAATHYITFADELINNQQFTIDDLKPTTLQSTQVYFRLTDDIRFEEDDGVKRWFEKSKQLIKISGFNDALYRAISLPIPLSDLFKDKLKKLSEKEAVTLLNVLEKRAFSLITRMHLLDISLLLVKKYSDSLKFAQNQIDYFFSDRFKEEFELFQVVLEDTANLFGMHVDAINTSWYNRTLSAWGHTSIILNYILKGNIPIGNLIAQYRSSKELALHDFYKTDFPKIVELIDPETITSSYIRYHGVGAILSKYPDQLSNIENIPEIGKHISALFEGKEPNFELFSLIQNPDFLNNQTKCFWGEKRNIALKPFVFDKKILALTSSKMLHKFSSDSIEKLNENPNDMKNWILLNQIVGLGTLNKKKTGSFNKVLDIADYNSLFEASSSLFVYIAPMLIEHIRDVQKIEDFMFSILGKLEDGDYLSSGSEKEIRFLSENLVIDLLLRWSLLISKKENLSENVDMKFVDILSRLMKASPRFTSALRMPITALSRQLAYKIHSHLYTLPLLAKSLPE